MTSFGAKGTRSGGPAVFDKDELEKTEKERLNRDRRIRAEVRDKAAKALAKERAQNAELEAKLERFKKPPLPSPGDETLSMHAEDERLASILSTGLDRRKAVEVVETVKTSIKKGDTPEKAKKAVEKKFTEEEKKGFDMNSLLGLVPLFLMQQGGGIFGNDSSSSSDASKEETAAEIERMEGMIEDLKQLRKEVKTEKESGSKEINKTDVDDALKLCRKKNNKYKAYLSELEKYSVGLEEIAQKILDGVEKNINKSKNLHGKKSKSTSKNNESKTKNKDNSKNSKE